MNKLEILEQLKQGKKVTHHYFASDEYIYMIGDNLYDEEDCLLDKGEFWKSRSLENWNKDWNVIN